MSKSAYQSAYCRRRIAEGKCPVCGKVNTSHRKWSCDACHARTAPKCRDYYHKHTKYWQSYNFQKKKKWIDEIKTAKGYLKCGETHPACLDFHHRDPTQKLFRVSQAKHFSEKRRNEVLEEMAKCDLLCSNCHRKLHYPNRLV